MVTDALPDAVTGYHIDTTDSTVTANDDSYVTSESGSVSGNVLANDIAPDLVQDVTVINAPGGGTLTFNPDGTFSYNTDDDFETLGVGQTATESFTYEVTDSDGDTAQAIATITINGENDAPTFDDEAYSFAIDENNAAGAHIGQVSASDIDLGDSVTYSIADGNESGLFAIDATTGEITATGSFDYEADDAYSLDVLAIDGSGATDMATVDVAIGNVSEFPAGATAFDLSALGFHTGVDPDVANSETVPFVSVSATGTVGQTDLYRLDIAHDNSHVVFDIDYGQNQGVSFDPWINLLDESGNVIGHNDDASTGLGAGGSIDDYDSYLATDLDTGTYYLEVEQYPNTPFTVAGTYELQVSVEDGII